MHQPALSVPVTAKEFLSMLPDIEKAAALIEAAYIAGACAQLQELAGKNSDFHHVIIEHGSMGQRIHHDTFISTSPKETQSITIAAIKARAISKPTASERARAERLLAMWKDCEDIFNRLFLSAHPSASRIAARSPKLTGPDAASFARQMGEETTAALIEARQLDDAASRSANAPRRARAL
jgi:hypothetical protein